MPWFPVGEDDTNQWRLDIVALLAVAGESFVGEHAQAITASALGLLPRIMPAPQALLRPLRPVSLPSYPAKLVGVYSGVDADAVGFFANIIHPLEYLPPFGFKVIEVGHREDWEWERAMRRRDEFNQQSTENHNESKTAAQVSGIDPESGRPSSSQAIRRRPTVKEQLSDFVSNAPVPKTRSQRRGRTNLFSPLNFVSVISFLMSLGLIIAAIVWKDAVAIIAIGLISLAASVICYASWWRPIILSRRSNSPLAPKGDMIIRTRDGSILLIRCSENIARELYSGVQECRYFVSGIKYRFLMTVGTVLIIPSVILMGNCSFNMQILMGVAYTLQNILYWVMGSLPLHVFWDLGNYYWADITPADAMDAHQSNWDFEGDAKEGMPSFTRTLWYAIRETKRSSWVARSGAAPSTAQWKQWCAEAEEAARLGNRGWQAVGSKDEIMQRLYRETEEEREREGAKTQIPATPEKGITTEHELATIKEDKTEAETKLDTKDKAEPEVEQRPACTPEGEAKLESDVSTKDELVASKGEKPEVGETTRKGKLAEIDVTHDPAVEPKEEVKSEAKLSIADEAKSETEERSGREVRGSSKQTDDTDIWGLD